MGGFISLDKVRQTFGESLEGCGVKLTNLLLCKFNFTESAEPFILIDNEEYFIETEFVISTIIKMIGVSKSFYDRNSVEMSEEIFDHHVKGLTEKILEVSVLYKEEGSRKVIRGIVPQTHFSLTNLEVLNLVASYTGESRVHSVFFAEGSSPYSQKTIFAVISEALVSLNGVQYHKAVSIISSEVGGSDLFIHPILIDLETNNIFPLLLNSKPYSKISYLNPHNGTMVPQITRNLEGIKTVLDTVLDNLVFQLSIDLAYKEMIELAEDWATRRGFTQALSDKIQRNLTALIDTKDDNGNNYTFETLGDFIDLVQETLPKDNFERSLKATAFLSERLGFNYKIKKK